MATVEPQVCTAARASFVSVADEAGQAEYFRRAYFWALSERARSATCLAAGHG